MVNSPVYIVIILLIIEAAILALANKPVGKKLFRFLPSMFWIYFLPMLANTVGILPTENSIYGVIAKWILPAALVILLLSADIRGILRLGPKALGMMAASVTGVMIGALTVAMIYRQWLPPEGWKGIGALSASWIGGSANMIAVRQALDTPQVVFTPVVIVDPVISYFWMGLLIAVSSYQHSFDRWNKADIRLLDNLASRAGRINMAPRITIASMVWIAALSVGGSFIAVYLSHLLPTIKNIINPAAWAVITATLLGIGLSLTPIRRLESGGSNTVGYAMLYLVLASIGAQTSLTKIASVPIWLAAGVTWIAIHGFCLLIAARLLRAPMALAAAASQASIGGPASAPVVAAIYHPELASVGLLLAVLGNILGTFLGLLVSRLCYWVW